MSELNQQTEQAGLASASVSAIARRRMILASLGKGASVAAAVAVPMNSLAGIGTLSVTANRRRCTISGAIISGVIHSNETVTAECVGASPSYYSNPARWPTSLNLNPETSTLNDLFGNGSTDLLSDILTNSPSSDDAHWIAAFFNGATDSSEAVKNFPYTSAKVKEFYNLVPSDPYRSQALSFFVTYMETYVGSTATPLRQHQDKTDPSREKKPSK